MPNTKPDNKNYSLQIWFNPYAYREVFPDLTDDEVRYVIVTLEKLKQDLLIKVTNRQIKL